MSLTGVNKAEVQPAAFEEVCLWRSQTQPFFPDESERFGLGGS